MSFPVFDDIKNTLKNWSIKLTRRLQRLEEQNGAYVLNTEIETLQTWVNGKPVYRKVIEVKAFPNASTLTVEHNIQYSQIVKLSGIMFSGGIVTPLPYVTTNATLQVGIYMPNLKEILITAGSNRSSYSGYIIVEYTK